MDLTKDRVRSRHEMRALSRACRKCRMHLPQLRHTRCPMNRAVSARMVMCGC